MTDTAVPGGSNATAEERLRRGATANPERLRQHLRHLSVERRIERPALMRPQAASCSAPPRRPQWEPGRGLHNAHVATWHMARDPTTRPRVPIAVTLACVARAHGIDIDLIKSQDRHAASIGPRQIAMLVARRVGRQSMLEIGLAIGGRDHSTVIHGSRKIAVLATTDTRLAALVARLEIEAVCEWDARRLAMLSANKPRGETGAAS